MKNGIDLKTYLDASKDSYAGNIEEFRRRLEWIMLLSEENYKDEINRRDFIHSLASSLLVASSFLVAGFVTFICAAKYGNKNFINNTNAIIFSTLAGSFASISVFLQLVLVFYKKRVMLKTVSAIASDYLDKNTNFCNPYSENYGRILTLDKMINSLIRNNNIFSTIEKVSVVFLILFLIFFVICFFVI